MGHGWTDGDRFGDPPPRQMLCVALRQACFVVDGEGRKGTLMECCFRLLVAWLDSTVPRMNFGASGFRGFRVQISVEMRQRGTLNFIAVRSGVSTGAKWNISATERVEDDTMYY
jgi:hypothetical protein